MPTPDSPTGFDQARHVMCRYEARSHVNETMARTTFLCDERIAFVHVDNFSQLDRTVLTAFSGNGALLCVETINNKDGRGLDLAPEFSHLYTRSAVPADSDLHRVRKSGWIIAMDALRAYDTDADRRKTQKTAVIAHLRDMIREGDVRCFLFGESLMGPETSAATQRDNEPPARP